MKLVDLKCERCGAEMQLNEEKTIARCPYCKNKFLIAKEPSLEEQIKKAEKFCLFLLF
mgnify:CR=1 FL=1